MAKLLKSCKANRQATQARTTLSQLLNTMSTEADRRKLPPGHSSEIRAQQPKSTLLLLPWPLLARVHAAV